jgi:hypothetical protein
MAVIFVPHAGKGKGAMRLTLTLWVRYLATGKLLSHGHQEISTFLIAL